MEVQVWYKRTTARSPGPIHQEPTKSIAVWCNKTGGSLVFVASKPCPRIHLHNQSCKPELIRVPSEIGKRETAWIASDNLHAWFQPGILHLCTLWMTFCRIARTCCGRTCSRWMLGVGHGKASSILPASQQGSSYWRWLYRLIWWNLIKWTLYVLTSGYIYPCYAWRRVLAASCLCFRGVGV